VRGLHEEEERALEEHQLEGAQHLLRVRVRVRVRVGVRVGVRLRLRVKVRVS
jgi:hypothetical protein